MRQSKHPSAIPWLARRLCAILALAALNGLGGASGANAAEPGATEPCGAQVYHQFDFWIGDWLVYDGDSGKLVATDHVKKRQDGCVVEQNLAFSTDMYRRPGVAHRLSGTSVSRFDGEQWLQLWADNQWGAIAMKGTLRPDGSMELDSVIPSRGRDVRLIWTPEPGGVVRISQFVASTGTGKWDRDDDLLYRPDRKHRQASQSSSDASTPCRRSASTNGPRCAR